MSFDFKVVEAELENVAAAADLFDAYRVNYGQKSNRAGCAKFLRERLDRGEAKLLLALDQDNKPIGLTLLYRRFGSLRLSQDWIVNDIYVEPASRRNGVANALMKEAIYVAKSAGAGTLLVSTEASNTAAQTLYKSLGFKSIEGIELYNLRLSHK